MNFNDLGILGDWYEDQGENGELIRNLIFLFYVGTLHRSFNIDGYGDGGNLETFSSYFGTGEWLRHSYQVYGDGDWIYNGPRYLW